MKISVPRVLEGHEWVVGCDDEAIRLLGRGIEKSPQGSQWSPVCVERIVIDQGEGPFRESDFPWLGRHALVMRKPALDAVRDFVAPYAEILPLLCADADLWLMNVTSVVDALDLKKSEVIRYPSSGAIMKIVSHAFRPEALGDIQLFKIPDLRLSPIYAGEGFVDLIESSSLDALAFNTVWEEP